MRRSRLLVHLHWTNASEGEGEGQEGHVYTTPLRPPSRASFPSNVHAGIMLQNLERRSTSRQRSDVRSVPRPRLRVNTNSEIDVAALIYLHCALTVLALRKLSGLPQPGLHDASNAAPRVCGRNITWPTTILRHRPTTTPSSFDYHT